MGLEIQERAQKAEALKNSRREATMRNREGEETLQAIADNPAAIADSTIDDQSESGSGYMSMLKVAQRDRQALQDRERDRTTLVDDTNPFDVASEPPITSLPHPESPYSSILGQNMSMIDTTVLVDQHDAQTRMPMANMGPSLFPSHRGSSLRVDTSLSSPFSRTSSIMSRGIPNSGGATTTDGRIADIAPQVTQVTGHGVITGEAWIQDPDSDTEDDDTLPPLEKLTEEKAQIEEKAQATVDPIGDSEGSDERPPLTPLAQQMEDRSQDNIAHELMKFVAIARHYKASHSAILLSLLASISAVGKPDQKDFHRKLTALHGQVREIYEVNRISSAQVKREVANPVVKRLVWGKDIDSLLRDSHANIDAFGDAIWHQQITNDSTTIKP